MKTSDISGLICLQVEKNKIQTSRCMYYWRQSAGHYIYYWRRVVANPELW